MTMKFAIIGTSCAGKTTLTHALVARLKQYGVLADGVYSQDRKFSFPVSQIESEAAQNWMVANIIAKEADLSLHSDVDLLISDRSPLDLMAYYRAQFDTALSQAAQSYAIEWCKGYTALYYLDPLPYQDDTKRPPDEFRLRVDTVLRALVEHAQQAGVVVRHLPRNKILEDVMRSAGAHKPSAKHQLVPDDLQRLADFMQLQVVAKFPVDPDPLSDTDIWLIAPTLRASTFVDASRRLTAAAAGWIRGHCGPWPNFDVLVTTTADGLPPHVQHFKPGQHGLAPLNP